jgi:hypothetical protein
MERNIMMNPVPRSGFFATPESVEDLMEYIQRFNGSERVVATTVAMMALNLAHSMVAKEQVETVD